jgi:hypothetical protein
MQIEITGETERLIQAALASGQYASAEQFIAAMAQHFRADEKTTKPLAEHIDVAALADAQGIGPVQDYRELVADFWPKDESTDEFLAFLGEIRGRRDVQTDV